MVSRLLVVVALSSGVALCEPEPFEAAIAEIPDASEPAIAEMPGEGRLAGDDRGPTLILVVGAEGTAEYGRMFHEWAGRWDSAAERGGARTVRIEGPTEAQSARDQLRTALLDEEKQSAEELWVVLIGHGTFDGRTARFNLEGPDVSADDLAGWLGDFERPVAVINCASASGPFLTALSHPGRIVITATKSGQEQNFARFGDYLSKFVADPEADLDHDGQTSLLEAWLLAARRTDESYLSRGELPTEHSLLDDTGDGAGARPDAFRGVRPAKGISGKFAGDGHRAHQFALVRSEDEQRMPPQLRQRRDEIELEVVALRERKPQLSEAEYYGRLEKLLVELAEVTAKAAPIRTVSGDDETRR